MAGKGRLPRVDHLARTVGQDRRYRLLRLINQDDLGSLWEAEDTELRCPIAVRVLSKGVAGNRRQADEVRGRLEAVHERLDHPRVAYVYSYGERGAPEQYVVMEPMSGETLDRRLARAGPLDPADALDVAAQIAEGLQAAHDVGLVHGGLSAENVVLQGDGSVKVIDFGLGTGSETTGPGAIADDVSRLQALITEMVGGRDPIEQSGVLDSAAGSSAGELASRLQVAATEAAEKRAEVAAKQEEAARAAERAAREKEKVRTERIMAVEEATRLAEEARKTEEMARGEHARRASEAQAAEEARGVQETRLLEAGRGAEEAADSAEQARRQEEAARAEHARRAERARKAEEARRQREAGRREAERRAEEAAGRAEEARGAEEAARTEHARRADEVRRAEEALARARAILDELEGKSGDTAPSTEGAGSSPVPTALPPTAPGAGTSDRPAPAGDRHSGDEAPAAQSPEAGTGRPEPTRGGASPRRNGFSHRWPGRAWLLVGLAIPLAVAGSWFVVRDVGAERTPDPTRPVDGPTVTDVSAVTVPDLRGLTAAEARAHLSEQGLTLQTVVPVIGTPGVVQSNTPAPGKNVAPGTGVILFVGVEPDRLEEEAFAAS